LTTGWAARHPFSCNVVAGPPGRARLLGIYSGSNDNFVPVNIAFTSSDFDSDGIDEKIESTDDCAIEPVEQAGSGTLELGVGFEGFQHRTR
jgi:hypothetical protein